MLDPIREIGRLDRRMNLLLKEFWGKEFDVPRLTGTSEALPALEGWRTPAIDIVEKDDEIQVTADMPGINKEDINIDIQDNRVEIRAETREESREEKGGYLYRERRQGSFYRSFELPTSVDPNRAKASYNEGILTLHMPKAETVKKTRIKIE